MVTWNKWAEDRLSEEERQALENKNVVLPPLNQIINFEDVEFKNRVDFKRFIFPDNTTFQGATFSGLVQFEGATFSGWAQFDGATFSDWATFSGATFSDWATFSGTTFSSSADFGSVKFYSKTDFEGCSFSIAPAFHQATLHEDTNFRKCIFKKGGDDPGANERAWRTLKVAMNKTHNHQMELEFFGYELDERRKGFSMKTWEGLSQTLPILVYKIISGYGRSYSIPFFWLIVVIACFGGAYSFITTTDWAHAYSFSLTNTIPLLKASKETTEAIGAITPAVEWMMSIQSIVGVILVFLIGLGLRNKFGIK